MSPKTALTGLLIACLLFTTAAQAQTPLQPSYNAPGHSSVPSVVLGCLASDGLTPVICNSGSASFSKPGSVTYAAANAPAIATANVAVTLFTAGSVSTSCDIMNPVGNDTLYVDFTATAVAGSSTAMPIPAGGNYHCPFPPLGAVSAVADKPQTIVAVRY